MFIILSYWWMGSYFSKGTRCMLGTIMLYEEFDPLWHVLMFRQMVAKWWFDIPFNMSEVTWWSDVNQTYLARFHCKKISWVSGRSGGFIDHNSAFTNCSILIHSFQWYFNYITPFWLAANHYQQLSVRWKTWNISKKCMQLIGTKYKSDHDW